MEKPKLVMVYEDIHCPFCGSTDVSQTNESFNYKSGFWGLFFLSWIGALIFGFLCRTRIECICHECGGKFSFYDKERP